MKKLFLFSIIGILLIVGAIAIGQTISVYLSPEQKTTLSLKADINSLGYSNVNCTIKNNVSTCSTDIIDKNGEVKKITFFSTQENEQILLDLSKEINQSIHSISQTEKPKPIDVQPVEVIDNSNISVSDQVVTVDTPSQEKVTVDVVDDSANVKTYDNDVTLVTTTIVINETTNEEKTISYFSSTNSTDIEEDLNKAIENVVNDYYENKTFDGGRIDVR